MTNEKINLEDFSDDDHVGEAIACRFIGGTPPISRSTLYRGIRDGRFPAPLKLGPGTSRWKVGELRSYVQRMSAERDTGRAA